MARGEIIRGLTTAASIWTVAAIGLAVGGGLYFAAGVSTAVIVIILAGIKPLEEMYRARNQTCHLKVEAARGSISPEIIKDALNIRGAQIKRFLVRANDGRSDDEVTVVIGRVSSQDVKSFVDKLNQLSGVSSVSVSARHGRGVSEKL